MPVYLPYVLIYVLVCLVGHYLVAYLMLFMRWRVGLDGDPYHEWMGFLIGITERAGGTGT
jgi:hypothetical protein